MIYSKNEGNEYMANKVLTMLEVSQKQAYIFFSNKVQDNIVNSAVIIMVLENDFLEDVVADKTIYDKNKNMVYSGGGHIVLEFRTKKQAVEFTKRVTRFVYENFEGLIIFAATIDYDKQISPGDNCRKLAAQLEMKKSLRFPIFHQGSFGIEETDTTTFLPQAECVNREEKEKIRTKEKEMEEDRLPNGYKPAYLFEKLGVSKYRSNFIAVVHIDGNAMGKRVESLDIVSQDGRWDWNIYKKKIRKFSECIDSDFKSAYKEMEEDIATSKDNGRLDDLDLSENYFPVRKIIMAGDDICFVSEGRIGIECAVRFIEKLSKKKNSEDGAGYAACAGVAIVHQKYPFYKAYELSEKLCSNAKKYAASLSNDGSGKEICAIDWHIELGEIKDTLDEVRDDYKDVDGYTLTARPYFITSTSIEENEKVKEVKSYAEFKEQMIALQKVDDGIARSKIKRLRGALKSGKRATEHFLDFNKLRNIVIDDRKLLFDIIELLDTYIALDTEGR